MHPCPITHCNIQIADRHLMCGRHWKMVPEDLNKSVMDTWAAVNRYKTDKAARRNIPDVDDAIARYRAARNEAIAAVEHRLAARA